MSAADSRARVRLGRTAGRCRSGVERRARRRTASAAGTASTANGTCTTKMACHENACGEQAARDRPDGRADHAGRDPGRRRRAARRTRRPAARGTRPAPARRRAPARTEPRSAPRSTAPARTTPRSRRTPRCPTALKIRGCARAKPTAVGTAASPSTRLNAISTQATCADGGVAGAGGCRAARASPPRSPRAPAPRSPRAEEPRHDASDSPHQPWGTGSSIR